MSNFLKFFLPLYFILFFGIAFVAKSIIVAKKIGKTPLVLPNDDTAYGLVGFYFKFTIVFLFLYMFVFFFYPISTVNYLIISQLNHIHIKIIGVLIMLFALIWTIIAQHHMSNSWRIGIDKNTKTELITSGLFRYSRNPIFFGMVLSLIGLFMVAPNAITFLVLLVSYLLIQIQIRLEEEFLELQHGSSYLVYKQKVRRLI
jgi:protein-S-isoprenylcysteine O-methyltransferase Ste14